MAEWRGVVVMVMAWRNGGVMAAVMAKKWRRAKASEEGGGIKLTTKALCGIGGCRRRLFLAWRQTNVNDGLVALWRRRGPAALAKKEEAYR
jgi:hypothetical protein